MRDQHEDTLKLRKIPYLNLVHAVAHTFAHTHKWRESHEQQTVLTLLLTLINGGNYVKLH